MSSVVGKVFWPTDDEKKMVETMSGYGVPQAQIACLIRDGIAVNTLVKHFRRELDIGKAKANAKITQTLFQKAVDGDTTSILFWLKTQAGWKETHYVDVTKRNASDLTDQELYSIAATGRTGDIEAESSERKLN